MHKPQTIVNFIEEVAREAGDLLMTYFGTKLTRTIKTKESDFATEADIAAEEYIIKRIRDEFPDDAIVAEESGYHKTKGAEYTWIIDPLDGTHNFAHEKDNFGVMICRLQGEHLQLAVVNNPLKKLVATGYVHGGVMLNGAIVQLGHEPTSDVIVANRDLFDALSGIGKGESTHSAIGNTLAVLQGNAKAFVSASGFIWDFGPAVLLCAEAGWHVTDLEGNTFGWKGDITYGKPGVIAAPPAIHAEILKAFQA